MDKKDYIKSLKLTGIILFIIGILGSLFALQVYAIDPNTAPLEIKNNSRVYCNLICLPGSGTSGGSDTARFRTYFGITALTGSGSTGYVATGSTTGLPFIDYLYGNGSSTYNFSGFTNVAINGFSVASSGSLTAYVEKINGTGSGNVFTNTTLAGQGTLTATLRANGVDISSTEISYLDGVSSNLQTQITTNNNTLTGSVTNHTHTGSDGTTQISHSSITGTGSNSHAIIDTFIASKAAASGLASLDNNTLVVQNPTSGTSTPGASKILISLGTGKIDDSWLSDTVTKLGTPTTGNISEGSNLYYTNARVNSAVGSLSVDALSDVIITSPANGQFVTYNGSSWINGTSSTSVGWGAITGTPTDNGSIISSATNNTIPFRDSSGNVFISGIVGGTTTGALIIPSGTTAQRPGTLSIGMLRYNSSSLAGSGGTISDYPNYIVHTFTSSGTFVPPIAETAEIYDGVAWRTLHTGTGSIQHVSLFMVGGGGGGGSSGGGGGGAGGVIYYDNYSVNGTTTVVIGAGGAASSNGNNTTFGNITAIGGGAGGTNGDPHGKNGGSGGGGDNASTTPGSFMGSATVGVTGYGRNGGNGAGTGNNAGGGGGGGHSKGGNGATTTGGSGGDGVISPIGTSSAFAGGGGGYGATGAGAGGFGGGGDGGSAGGGNAVAGSANTGGGGGGAGSAGGSGIVIIRYLKH